MNEMNYQYNNAKIEDYIAKVIFDEIYPRRKIKYGKYSIPYDSYINDTIYYSSGGKIALHIITDTENTDYAEQKFIMDSYSRNEAIIVLNIDDQYYKKYEREKSARKYLCKAIENAKFYVCGKHFEIKNIGAENKIHASLKNLIENTYTKIKFVNKFAENKADVLDILNGCGEEIIIEGIGADNEYALNEISQWLQHRNQKLQSVTLKDLYERYSDLPFGWRKIDIAALTAKLIARDMISIHFDCDTAENNNKLTDVLCNEIEHEKVRILPREKLSDELICKITDFMYEYTGIKSIPPNEDRLVNFTVNFFEQKSEYYTNLLNKEYSCEMYPEKDLIITLYHTINNILAYKKNRTAFVNSILTHKEELFELNRKAADIENFFENQKEIFDSAVKWSIIMRNDRGYFTADTETLNYIKMIQNILIMPKPYDKISELPSMIQKIEESFNYILKLKKEEVKGIIIQCLGDIHTLAGFGSGLKEEIQRADNYFNMRKSEIEETDSISMLDVMISQLLNYKETVCIQFEIILSNRNKETNNTLDTILNKNRAITMRRYDIFPAKRLYSKEDADRYLELVKQKLYEILEDNDTIQIM